MTATVLPRDQNVFPVQGALRLLDGGAHKNLAVTNGASVRSVAFDANTRIITIFATAAIFLKLGNAAVAATANDHYIPANVLYPVAIHEDDQTVVVTNAAYIAVGGNADVYISERR